MKVTKSAAAAALLIAALARPGIAVEAPSSLQGTWSPDLACAATALRHVVGPTTLEWHEGGERLVEAKVHFRIRGNEIVALVRQAQNGDAPLRPGDVVTYERVAGGLRPIAIVRNDTTIDISQPRTFFACRG